MVAHEDSNPGLSGYKSRVCFRMFWAHTGRNSERRQPHDYTSLANLSQCVDSDIFEFFPGLLI